MTFAPQSRLTVAEALNIQAAQLKDWKLVLKPEAYELLERAILTINHRSNYIDGYDVFRGIAIDTLVHNEIMNAFRQ